ncbi:hypothetical protein DKX38_005396 [Salix brachista]|uniref:Protein kinase domain-containing protein n=1 Tax=Salix brachista TaxID=2182728 RepID=A0A5N5MZN1_9ROSI|nr:hypothetical protein DKX38_005396 [Salix brachista]
MKFFPCCIPEREDALVESTSCTDKESAKLGRALSSWKNMSWKIGSSKRKNSLKVFTYHELSVATDDFNPSFSVGEGGFGKVYKGLIESIDKHVAVKQLDRNGRQGNKEFFSEVNTLSMVQHPNLVKLIGYCVDGDQRLLVYEFMPNESLETHLLDLPPGRKPLDWTTRMKIATGAAQGLEYLHDTADPQIIYRDFKASNILLDQNFNAKLSDFGLAKLGPTGGKDHVSTRVMGTYGYCAPEYQLTGQLTTRSDVYSFGVVLLEIITGKRVIDMSRPTEEQNLVHWAGPLFKDKSKFTAMADPLLEGNYSQKSLYQALAIAAMCLQVEADTRPLMADVVTALEFLTGPIEEKKPTVSPTQSIHHVNSVTEGNVKQELEKNNSFKGSRSSWKSKGYGKQGKTLSFVRNLSYKIASSKRKNINQVFTFRELAVATSNFNHHFLVGEGGFGRVYKGYIDSVDQLDRKGLQGNREFFSEVLTLSMVKHLNLVKLIGYCADGDQRLLVYEFMANGSLENHLLDLPPGKEPLDWSTRMKIASGAAQGLEYLHGVADPQIIYRDFKASNILLDEDFNPKLSDFGLAKLGPTGGKDHVSTRVMGTYGYCAPEYQMTGQLTTRSDVYSFGVVLLEIISGRRVIDRSRPTEEQNLIHWAAPLLKDRSKFTEMADPLLEGNYPKKSLYQALAIASMCVHEEADARPLMADVVTAFEFLTTPAEEEKPTMASTESIHYVESVKGGNVKDELEA